MRLTRIFLVLGLCFSHGVFSSEEITAEIPLFTPFNWAASSRAYLIEGTVCNYISVLPAADQPPCGPAIFVVDPVNQRWATFFGANGGSSYILPTTSYVYGNDPSNPTACLQMTGFTFADEVAGYQNVLSMPGSTGLLAHYFGLAADAATCSGKLAANLRMSGNIVTAFNFAQLFPVIGQCAYVTGSLDLNIATLSFLSTAEADPYFVLPANCNASTPDYCAATFPPGNPCNNG
jgi:hypothetical protein